MNEIVEMSRYFQKIHGNLISLPIIHGNKQENHTITYFSLF